MEGGEARSLRAPDQRETRAPQPVPAEAAPKEVEGGRYREVHTGKRVREGSWAEERPEAQPFFLWSLREITACALPDTDHNRFPAPVSWKRWPLAFELDLERYVDGQRRCSRKGRVGPRGGGRKHSHLWGTRSDSTCQVVLLGLRGSSQRKAGQGQCTEGHKA